MYQLSGERYRDGAHEWGVYQDAAEPSVWIEWFFLPSWDEHLRQHERATKHDQDIHARARQFHRGAERSEEHTSELQSLMRISYAVFCLKKKKTKPPNHNK